MPQPPASLKQMLKTTAYREFEVHGDQEAPRMVTVADEGTSVAGSAVAWTGRGCPEITRLFTSLAQLEAEMEISVDTTRPSSPFAELCTEEETE